MLSGVIVAAALAAVEHSILGSNPIFYGGCRRTRSPTCHRWSRYALLGPPAAIVSVGFTDSLLGLRAWFKGLTNVPKWIQPAIGGAATGQF